MRSASLLLISAASIFISAQAPVQTPEEYEKRRLRWEGVLRDALKGVEASVVADVDLTRDPSIVPTGAAVGNEDLRTRVIASAMERDLLATETGYVYARRPGFAHGARNDTSAVSRWLAAISDAELASLCGKGASFSSLKPPTQSLFARLCPNPGLRQRMLTGSFARATVRMQIVATAVGQDGRVRTMAVDPFERDSEKEEAIREKMEREYKPDPAAPTRAFKASTGPLDFGDGTVLTLRDALKRAQATFSKPFRYDSRIADSTYFWRGRFTLQSFVNSLENVTKITEAGLEEDTNLNSKERIDRLFRERVAGLLDPAFAPKGMDYSDALSSKSMTADELNALFPNWKAGMKANGIDPSASFKLQACLSLQLTASGNFKDPARPGESPIGNRWGIVFVP